MRSILSILLPVALAAACGSTSTNAPVAGGSDATTDSGGRPDASRTHPADARADRGVDAAIDAGSDGGLTCPPFDVVCGSGANAFCAPIQVDPDNCGGCGLECPAGTYCSEASCGATCIGLTSALCSGTCVDTQSDNKNCGVCAHPCPAGQVCSAGACAPTCATSYTPCGEGASSYCAETPIDPENCGACGTVCPIGATCSGGHCRAAVRDAGQPAMDSGDLDAAQADAHHVDAGRDAGSCTGLAEGATCASATACTSASTCKSGVCTASALADGTVCGAAPNSCHEAPTCKSGACSAALPVAKVPCAVRRRTRATRRPSARRGVRRRSQRRERHHVRHGAERVPRRSVLHEWHVQAGGGARGWHELEGRRRERPLLRRQPRRHDDHDELRGLRLEVRFGPDLRRNRGALPVHRLHGRQRVRVGLLLGGPGPEPLLAQQLRRRVQVSRRLHGRVALHRGHDVDYCSY